MSHSGLFALTRFLTTLQGISRDLAEGACAGEDPELWFPTGEMTPREQGQRVRVAKSICAECPMRSACLKGALERREGWGVWGGLTVTERNQLLRATA